MWHVLLGIYRVYNVVYTACTLLLYILDMHIYVARRQYLLSFLFICLPAIDVCSAEPPLFTLPSASVFCKLCCTWADTVYSIYSIKYMPISIYYISFCFLVFPSKKALSSSPLQTEPLLNYKATLSPQLSIVSDICTTTTTIAVYYRVSCCPF